MSRPRNESPGSTVSYVPEPALEWLFKFGASLPHWRANVVLA